jgi:hypothetical protein
MVKKISVSGILGKSSKNFHQFKIQKIENLCRECGGKTTPEKPYGLIYIPKSVGIPEQILINVRKSDSEGSKD